MDNIIALIDELREIIEVLEENRLEYAVSGGLSLAVHGFPRAPFDIDNLIQPE